ncbi:MAG TPA: patatin-like phospholipase family protein [Cytophagales bacterium]|nr:patatin-like phospholipase family protein [Cytophagales bacterium]
MKIGLALSGGGTRGIAHLGVYKAFLEQGIKVSRISGVSAGAIAGAFIASGIHPDELLDILLKTRLYKYFRPGITSTGVFKLELLEVLFKKYLKEENFEDLKIPLITSALNIKTGRIEYFDKGSLIPAILASSSMPMIFNPIHINGQKYIDGGLVENLPVSALKTHCDYIIGVHTNPINEDYNKLTVRRYIERIFLITINNNAQQSLKEADFVIEPEGLKNIRWSDYSRAKEIFEMGYKCALELLPQLKEKLKRSNIF